MKGWIIGIGCAVVVLMGAAWLTTQRAAMSPPMALPSPTVERLPTTVKVPHPPQLPSPTPTASKTGPGGTIKHHPGHHPHLPEGTPAPNATPTPNATPDSSSDEDAQYLKRLQKGDFKYQRPLEMSIGEPTRVSARLASTPNLPEMTAPFPGAAPTIRATVPVGRYMKAYLTGDAFTITPVVGNAQQPVIAGATAQWEWDVTPKTSGTYPLTMSLDLIKFPDHPERWAHPIHVVHDPIHVRVKPVDGVAQALRWLLDNWQKLLALSGSLIALWGWLKARRKASKTKKLRRNR